VLNNGTKKHRITPTTGIRAEENRKERKHKNNIQKCHIYILVF
jgi:hypothetical protein